MGGINNFSSRVENSMNYIKSIYIEGFKKFESLYVEFNQRMNIIVGENEAGKSTVLEAIKIVLNQQYKNSDKSILRELFNVKKVKEFKANPSAQTLPSILIEVELDIDPRSRNAPCFYGEVHSGKISKGQKYGIKFECRYDDVVDPDVERIIADGDVPYEYYSLTWTTFANQSYQSIRKPFNFLSVDTSSQIATSSFNYYNKSLFISKYDEYERMRAKNKFRSGLESVFDKLGLPGIDCNRVFRVDIKKVILENVISVFEDSVSLESRGKGMENLIKTQIALDRNNHVDVISIEEPENHLSISTLNKMLDEITNKRSESQIILTTHSSLIASRLNLNNILWIAKTEVKSLSKIEKDDAEFFVKADNNSLLHLLLSEKAFLVEGNTEFLLLPKLYKQVTGNSLEHDRISVISCGGIAYKRYLSLVEGANKKVAIITDNDHDQENIKKAMEFNLKHVNQQIFTGKTTEDWTWEACFYNLNKEVLTSLVAPKKGAKYSYSGEGCDPVLGKMLKNKTDTAYAMLKSDVEFNIPEYVREAIEWLRR